MTSDKEIELIRILEHNGRVETEVLAKMLDESEEDVKVCMQKLEDEQVILSYTAIVDWSKVTKEETIAAMIDVKVTPQRDVGFDEVAARIQRFPEVSALYLMSGTYDLSVVVEGQTMDGVARFVSNKLSTLDAVLSTTTHFRLKKYKHDGVVFNQDEKDRRMVVSP
ncbi:Lrp/AsnC family transcriptional regulator [Natribacillus halophilus]|uniref:DNA-binding transcriptional regulator, Lrp family n=1 Tax=Natribacillus halophilus TaxID=549003 RepID=A0A1G8NMQ4_9BACI|nr:Lrp/AsnC family transcriptional regulator [Natribacillus halophilus]SDI81465.1 DNA-binding transcriptional regulator, Lrp family [Natribacillus halophilus]